MYLVKKTFPCFEFYYLLFFKVVEYIEEGITMFLCSLCKKTSRHRKNIRRHMVTHLRLKPYSCSYCSHAFSDPSNRKRHEKRQHNM